MAGYTAQLLTSAAGFHQILGKIRVLEETEENKYQITNTIKGVLIQRIYTLFESRGPVRLKRILRSTTLTTHE